MQDIILSNQIRCQLCGDEPYSAHRHDYKECKCGAVAVDGGMSYLRRSGTEYDDMSILLDKKVFAAVVGALQWCDENKRNNLGRICAVFRALRDIGYLDKLK